MRLLTDEIFGPVLAFQRAGSFDEALALANDTAFGLSASVVTRSLSAAQRFIAESRTGLVKVNQPPREWP